MIASWFARLTCFWLNTLTCLNSTTVQGCCFFVFQQLLFVYSKQMCCFQHVRWYSDIFWFVEQTKLCLYYNALLLLYYKKATCSILKQADWWYSNILIWLHQRHLEFCICNHLTWFIFNSCLFYRNIYLCCIQIR